MVDKGLFSESAWLFAMGASEFVSAPLSEIDIIDEERLFELRVFDEKHEIKMVRGSLSEDFQRRDSTEIKADKQRKERYYLDIDDKKTKSEPELGFVWAIGSGKYRLPIPCPQKIEVEHYYKADIKGFYKPFDFRVVGFCKGESE
jgi:hypothetical protein